MTNRRPVTFAAVLAAAIVAHVCAAEERFSVGIRAVTTRSDGATTSAFQAGSTTAVGGPSPEWTVGLGRFGSDGEIRDELVDPTLVQSSQFEVVPHILKVAATVREAALDRVILDLRWTHLVARRADDEPSEVASDARQVSLPEGGKRVVEVFRAERQSGAEVVNAFIEIEVNRIEDPSLAPHGLRYRMWVGHPSGVTLHAPTPAEAIGGQGERIRVRSEPSSATLAGVTSDAGGTVEMSLSVFLEALGRLRPDGRLDLSLSAMRVVYLSAPGTPGSIHQGSAGRGLEQRLQIRPGEPIRLELPGPPELTLPGTYTVEPDAPGVRAEADRLVVDGAELLGETTEVTLVVDIQPGAN